MEQIKSLKDMVSFLKETGSRKKIAVACAEDSNTIGALARAFEEGIAEPILIGSEKQILKAFADQNLSADPFTVIDIPDEIKAAEKAVEMVKNDEADILMKGLIGTDKFLRAVLNKEKGLLPPKAVMSYVCALEIPKYHKLLFISDPAVIPFPDLKQKTAMINYSVKMAQRFGIKKPKVALIGASEKPSLGFPDSVDYALLSKMSDRGQIRDAVIDGPLDVFLACDKESIEIKGVKTPVDGDADILIFPDIQACNSFYKGLMLFAGAELGGIIQGTEKPVVVMSRSESALSKFYCISLSCIMA